MSFSSSSTVPIHMLPGIGQRTAQVLMSLGIRTVGQFKQLPESLLVELFGPSIRSVYTYVQGKSVARTQTSHAIQKYKYRLPIGKKFQLASQLFSIL